MNLKKIGKELTSKFVGTGPPRLIKKEFTGGRGLTKVEKHWSKSLKPFVISLGARKCFGLPCSYLAA